MESFEGKVALITGAASGLGKALCLALAGEGARVIAVDIDGEGAGETARSIVGQGMDCLSLRTDVSKKEEMESLAVDVLSRYGRVDLLMNVAGVGIGGSVDLLTLDDWEFSLAVNTWSNIYGVHYFLPRMIETGGGHIVTVSSIGGLVPLPTAASYAVAKFALVGMFGSLRFDLAKHNVGVTVVCPGGMRTGFFYHFQRRFDEERDRKVLRLLDWAWKALAQSPEKVVAKTILGIKRNRPLVITGKEAYLSYYLYRLSPRLYFRINELLSRWFL